MQKRRGSFILISLLIATIIVTGCTAARKPEVNNNRNPVAQENQQAESLAREATQVQNVKSAYVVISGNMAVVGVNIDSKLDKSSIEQVKSDVGQRIKQADRQITDVRVSTDVDTVTRIRNIASGISEGRPLSGFANEINEIARRITPTKE